MSGPSDLTLHGYAVSNYFNTVRAAVIEKGAACQVVTTRSSQDAAFLECSPMGKIPYLETADGCLAETTAILDYLEDARVGAPLLPSDPYSRGRVRQAINIVQVYVEVPLRALFPGVFMGGRNSAETELTARMAVDRAIRALSHIAALRPFLLGDALTSADLFAFYTFDIGERVMRHVYDASLFDQLPSLRDWDAAMRARRSTQVVLADFAPAFAGYLRDKNAAWREPEPKDAFHA